MYLLPSLYNIHITVHTSDIPVWTVFLMKKLILFAVLIYVFCSIFHYSEFKDDWECVTKYYSENALFANVYIQDIRDAGLRVKDSLVGFLQPAIETFTDYIS